MRLKLYTFLTLIGLLISSVVYALPTTTYLYSNTYPASTTKFSFGTSTKAWNDITTVSLCLTGDSCRTTWPTGSGGGGATGINTSSPNQFAFYITSSTVSGTPYVQFANNSLVISTNTLFTTINASSTTSTNLYVSSLANFGNPANGLFWNTASGSLAIGFNNSQHLLNGDLYDEELSIHATGTNHITQISVHRHSDSADLGAYFLLNRTRGTEANETALLANDSIGGIFFAGHTGSSTQGYSLGSAIQSYASENFYATSSPADLRFFTTPSGTTSTVERLRILSNGNIGINTTSALARLFVQGSGTENPFAVVSSTVTGTPMLTVLTNGNVGINQGAPADPFDVVGKGTGNLVLGYFYKNDNTGTAILRVGAGSASRNIDFEYNTGGGGPFRYGTFADANVVNNDLTASGRFSNMNFVTHGTVGMTLTGGNYVGNLGVGTSSPVARLTVKGNTTTAIVFDVASSTDDSMLMVNALGYVGINSSSPTSLFSIQGGNLAIIGGGIRDNSGSLGSDGMVLKSSGTGFNWVTTSSLGISGGSGTFTTTSINGAVSTTFHFTTSSDTNIGLSITTSTDAVIFNPYWVGTLADNRITSASNWNAWLLYPAIASSSFVAIPATPVVTSTYQMGADGKTILKPNATSSITISVTNATTSMYAFTPVPNAFISQKLTCAIAASAASGISFTLSYQASSNRSAASTSIGTFTVQDQATGTTFSAIATIPQDNYLTILGTAASSTNVDYLSCALKGYKANN